MRIPDIIPITDGPNGYGISPINNCQAGYSLYQCPGCGRTVTEPLVGTYSINKTCTCNFPTVVYIMNRVSFWQHPMWIEFDERCYWEDKGLMTEGPFIPYFGKTEEELWREGMKKSSPPTPLNGYASNVKVTTKGKFRSLILRIRNLRMGSEKLPRQ